MADPIEPRSTTNYTWMRGQLFFKPTGASDFTSMGHVEKCELTQNITWAEHEDMTNGVSFVDNKVADKVEQKLTITADELTRRNLALFMLGSIAGNDSSEVHFLTQPAGHDGYLQFVAATNTRGRQINLFFPRVTILPSGSLSVVAKEQAKLSFEASCKFVDPATDPTIKNGWGWGEFLN